ncbi:MAG TPA: hypothetical protein VHI52_01220, partial [Verrucomicrobiae bacterium]|nr:hypothetical protein [Verrucomicrobiae bacterium]
MAAVVENDGTHSMVEKSGAVFLEAGWHPLRLDWFNGAERAGLELRYEGPGLKLQKIPDELLWHVEPKGQIGGTNFVRGLEFRCYEGDWELLPDFNRLTPTRSGVSANCDIAASSRTEHVGLRFEGFLEIRRRGLYIFRTRSDDGSRLSVGRSNIAVEICGPGPRPEPKPLSLGQSTGELEDCTWTEVRGRVTFARRDNEGLKLTVRAGAASLEVEVADGSGLQADQLMNRMITATGCCRTGYASDGHRTPTLLLLNGNADISGSIPASAPEPHHNEGTALPVLTSAGEVHALRREEAQRGYPARVRGVVTCVLPEHQAFTVQDLTSGLYVVDFSSSRSVPPELGEYLEIDGVTDPGLFAPVVNANWVRSHGLGHLPEPVRPTWDQLINGSLDAQYCELEGIVLSVETNTLVLRTHGGVLHAELRLRNSAPGLLAHAQNAVVRICGCLFASWDYVTHHVTLGAVRIYSAELTIEQPAPEDLFACQQK